MKQRAITGWVLLLAAAILSGCVTSTESVFTSEASPKDAAEKRLELARSYIGQGDWENAERNLRQARELDPGSAEVSEAFALVYQSTGEYELAEKSFRKALSTQRDFSRARNNFAAFLYQRQRYQEANDQLEIVVKDTLYSGRPRAFVNLGLCRVQLEDYVGAKAAFERSLTMDRSNALAMLELARVEYELQEYAAARRWYDMHRGFVRRPSAGALWLGIRIAHAQGDADTEASHALALRNLYPKSQEYREYEDAKARGSL